MDLRAPRNQLDVRAVRMWRVEALLVSVPPVVVLLVLALVFRDVSSWLLAAAAGVALVGLVYTVMMPRIRFRVHRWEVTDEAVYATSGWLVREWRAAPLSRIQTVDSVRGPLARLFGLAQVTVTTASAAGPVHISALDAELAARIVAQLASDTQAIPGDAT